jgi:hypothetical protein
MSASCPTGRNAAANATTPPVMAVTICGVFHFGMNVRKPLRQQPVARHHEEDPGLAEQQDEDHRTAAR